MFSCNYQVFPFLNGVYLYSVLPLVFDARIMWPKYRDYSFAKSKHPLQLIRYALYHFYEEKTTCRCEGRAG